jgi:lipopolysaccharide export system permease protein
MLFHSSIRNELARTFGATLVILISVVMTTTVIRTLGEATRGIFNPTDVMIVMGYSLLSQLPAILSFSLFLAIVSVLTRMYRDSEMVIWLGSGRGLASLIRPLLRFAWPVFVLILTLALLVLPWAFSQIEDLRDKYQKRSDVSRVEPGQFQESANGDKVFFIDKDSSNKEQGINVFMVTRERGIETVTSANRGTVQVNEGQKRLVLENGQRVEIALGSRESNFSTFERYTIKLGFDAPSARNFVPASTLSTIDLLASPLPLHRGELVWRAGFFLAALNVIFLGLAVSGFNPRVGRASNLVFAFMAYLAYFNMLALGKNWVETEQMPASLLLLYLHGGVLALSLLCLAIRHNHWALRLPARWRTGDSR